MFLIGYGLDFQKLSHDFMIGIEMKLVSLELAENVIWPGGWSLLNSYGFYFASGRHRLGTSYCDTIYSYLYFSKFVSPYIFSYCSD